MEKNMERRAAELMKNKEAVAKLLQSQDAQQLLKLLQQEGGAEQAARDAADGSPGELIRRVQQLMSTPEGGQLVRRIREKAKESGLKE